MGSLNCTKNQQIHVSLDTDLLCIQYGEDSAIKDCYHRQELSCRNRQLQKIFQSFSETLLKNRTKYKDPVLSSEPIKLQSSNAQLSCAFERPESIFSQGYQNNMYQFLETSVLSPCFIEVKDQLMQYFGVFLCFLASQPEILQKIFLIRQNTFGLYCVEAYIHGLKKFIAIDDYILCHQGKPLFSQPYQNKYIWSNILEKAWLKITRSFSKKIQSNEPQELFSTFAPYPIEHKVVQSLNKAELVKLFQKNNFTRKYYILITKQHPKHMIGISGGKYLFLLGTFNFQEKFYFFVRNPCTQASFRGLHSDLQRQMEQRIYEQLKMNCNLGNFVLDMDQFFQQIQEIIIIHYLPEYSFTTQPFHQNHQQQFFSFNLRQKGLLSLSLQQIPKGSRHDFSPISYQIFDSQRKKLISGLQNYEGCFGLKKISNSFLEIDLIDGIVQQLQSGSYILRIKRKPEKKEEFLRVFSILSSENVKLIQEKQNQLYEQWHSFLIECGKTALKISKNVYKRGQTKHVVEWIGDLAFIYIQNKMKNKKKLNLQVRFPQIRNLECISHPKLNKTQQYHVIKMEGSLLLVFEKIQLSKQASINHYHFETF